MEATHCWWKVKGVDTYTHALVHAQDTEARMFHEPPSPAPRRQLRTRCSRNGHRTRSAETPGSLKRGCYRRRLSRSLGRHCASRCTQQSRAESELSTCPATRSSKARGRTNERRPRGWRWLSAPLLTATSGRAATCACLRSRRKHSGCRGGQLVKGAGHARIYIRTHMMAARHSMLLCLVGLSSLVSLLGRCSMLE